jgi:ABC-2 type transport system permease protein
VNSQASVVASSAAGSIYDLGYRHYEGSRRGRLWATWSLFVESMRGIWGLGRPTTAKAAPFILAGLYALPAAFQLAFSSVLANAIQTGEATSLDLMSYHSYFNQWFTFILFFLIAQAPELVCRDQRYRVLPLYFTRPLGRIDYIGARVGSLAVSLFLILMLPCIELFIGDILMKPDTFKAFGEELPKFLPSLPANALIAVGLAVLCLAVASFSVRRAYAAIAILAYVLLAESIPGIIYEVGKQSDWSWSDKLTFFTPFTSLIGGTEWFFGMRLDPSQYPASLSADQYVVASIASVLVFASVLILRYRRVSA